MILDKPELIHDKSFMMVIMDLWAAELPPFQEYLYRKLKHYNTNDFNSTSSTNAVPLKEILKELFYPTNKDNKKRNQMIEDLVFVAATRRVQELLDPNKATYSLMYESGAELYWDGSSDNLKYALLGFMDMNDIAESSFAGVTDQL